MCGIALSNNVGFESIVSGQWALWVQSYSKVSI